MYSTVRPRIAACDGLAGGGRLNDRLAGVAGKLRPHVADELDDDRFDIEHLIVVLAETAELAAALRAPQEDRLVREGVPRFGDRGAQN